MKENENIKINNHDDSIVKKLDRIIEKSKAENEALKKILIGLVKCENDEKANITKK